MDATQYFWFTGLLFGPVAAVLTHLEFRSIAENSPELRKASRFLVTCVGLLFSIPYVLIGIIQLIGRKPNPGFVLTWNLHDKWVLAALAVVVLTHVGAFLVVRRLAVADLISRLQYVRLSRSGVCFWGQVIVLGSLAINVVAAVFNVGAR